jgi:hypothetical protein
MFLLNVCFVSLLFVTKDSVFFHEYNCTASPDDKGVNEYLQTGELRN